MSLRNLPRASIALKSNRRSAVCGVGAGVRRITQRRWASDDKKGGDADKPFYLQLHESIYERVQKEKAEQIQIQSLQQRSARGQFFATVFACLFTAGIGYYFGQLIPPKPDTNSTAPLETFTPPKHNISEANMEAAWADFRNIVGKENITLEKSELVSHSGSSWSSHPAEPGDIPFCVIKPGNTLEVSAIMKVCHERKIPITPYSGGTSLEGHFAATKGGICVDFSRMDKILKLHKDDLDVVVQPAVGWERLNEELAKENLFFPPDPGPGAMIGGMVGTGCSGTNSYRYGTMKDWVLSLTVVLADGTVIKTRQRPRKSSAGYDLTRMFIGSEGTLGLVTEATLKVTVKPQHTSVAVCAFPTIRAASDCVFKVVGAGVPIAAIEILDDVQMMCINDAGQTSKTWKNAPTLFFKFAGTPNSVKEQISQVQTLAKNSGSVSFEFAKSEQEKEDLWQARKEALWSVMAKTEGHEDMAVWTTDVAVPISRLSQIIEETKEKISQSGLLGSIVGHVGDGNFHSIILYNRKTDFQKAEHLVHEMVKRAIELEGTATGEHGVGLVKRDYLPHELGTSTVDAMRQLKKAFDPLCLLNCDKIVRASVPKAGEVAEW
ncbi:D-lactate dehydrogenase mitochondrial precursor [Cucurbitaria berberidis CBS 394.84]|uniref:D-lactate dehydrogenase (cytochrome) n=1 Tax=Cucurbitaria berberidis CBS 394.84 TaxID=1168544 RepID=A0A9P4GUS7_9PLEO|nr:D-lactate dehydrogenase mitochondrial precursor [Cucurbitaria berberidis CBS 394.84]KAF1851411.1 D-lactate dehydrogenase mitochondrial precursor [Cucurbitaria berberidis CBS 394.84]